MGNLMCRPASHILDSPSVISCAEVGDITVISGIFTVTNSSDKRCWDGILYIKGDSLYYQTKMGSLLCCKSIQLRFKLSEIMKIQVIKGTLELPNNTILNPGLKITLEKPTITTTTTSRSITSHTTTTKTTVTKRYIFVDMVEADRFAMDLVYASGIASAMSIIEG